jgi:hypothetical protein
LRSPQFDAYPLREREAGAGEGEGDCITPPNGLFYLQAAPDYASRAKPNKTKQRSLDLLSFIRQNLDFSMVTTIPNKILFISLLSPAAPRGTATPFSQRPKRTMDSDYPEEIAASA